MRLLVRLALIGCAFILFLIFIAYNKSSSLESIEEQKEADEVARILQSSFNEPQGEISEKNAPPLTLNIAIVLIVSLLSVALLITGIIVVAVTMDPGSDEEKENEDSNSTGDVESGGECGEFLGDFDANGKWQKAWSNFNYVTPDDDDFILEKKSPIKNGYHKTNYSYVKNGLRPDARRKSLSS
uniref:Uncharacterized protein n=1 Tax=Acrobeloides nanus TaxID=290746 RepID=A0A914BUS1_9BILA